MTPEGWPTGQFRVIVADCPWSFKMRSDKGYTERPQHYARMSLEDLKALPVRDLADPRGCRLFLWATMPHLEQAFEVMRAWKFRYSTSRAWAKLWPSEDGLVIFPDSLARGTGYEVTGNVELILIGKVGKPPPVGKKKPASLFFGQRRQHSRKPDCFMDEVSRLFDGPRLELFAREARPGWTSFGNETKKFGGNADVEPLRGDCDRVLPGPGG